MLCAFLRHKGIPARARCGFSTYFEPGKYVDHWVCEYWNAGEARWVQVDAQLDSLRSASSKPDFDPLDVPRDRFLVAGDVWQQIRAGTIDRVALRHRRHVGRLVRPRRSRARCRCASEGRAAAVGALRHREGAAVDDPGYAGTARARRSRGGAHGERRRGRRSHELLALAGARRAPPSARRHDRSGASGRPHSARRRATRSSSS